MKSIILDTETTGLIKPGAPLEQQPQIIELGAIRIDDDGKVADELSQLINPGIALPEIITKITGVTDEQLVGMPTFEDYLPRLIDFFQWLPIYTQRQKTDVLICHNAAFDVGMLRNELMRAKCLDFPWPNITVCTVQEYKTFMGGKWPKMTELYKKVMGKELDQKHRALDDVIALNEILTKDKFFEKVNG